MRGKFLALAGAAALLGTAGSAIAQSGDGPAPQGMPTQYQPPPSSPYPGQYQGQQGQYMGQPGQAYPGQYQAPPQQPQYQAPTMPQGQYQQQPVPSATGQQGMNIQVPPGAEVTVQPYGTSEEQRMAARGAAAGAERKRYSPYQTSLSVGGGVANFIRDRISDNTGTAGAWDVRLGVGTRFPLGFEAAYLGTAQRADDPFASRTISTTQVFGQLRLNLSTWRIQPFLAGGVGWANLHRSGTAADSPVAAANFNHNANDVVVPFSGGFATYLGKHGLIDARFNYHLIPEKGFTNQDVRPDMWIAELRAGYAF